MTSNQQSPAGWYPIPTDPNTQRYFNGSQWTDQFRPVPAASSHIPEPQRLPPSPKDGKPLWKKKRFFLPIGGVTALLVLGALTPPPEEFASTDTLTTETSVATTDTEPAKDREPVEDIDLETTTTTQQPDEPASTTTTIATVLGADGQSLRLQFDEVAMTTMGVALPARQSERDCKLRIPEVVRTLTFSVINSLDETISEAPSTDAFGDWLDNRCLARFALGFDPAELTNDLTVTAGNETFALTIEDVFSGQMDGPDHVLPLTLTFDDPQPFGKGTHLVGTDIEPGIYSINPGQSCYWERLSGVSGDLDDILSNDNTVSRTILEIVASDFAFNSNCGPWVRFFPNLMPESSFKAGDWRVGLDIEPGIYRSEGQEGCYWERASGFTHSFGEILANDNIEGPGIVEIKSSDERFSAGPGCGTWTKTG